MTQTTLSSLVSTCCETLGNKVDNVISSAFSKLGFKIASRPKAIITVTLLFGVACGSGLAILKTETNSEKLWVPQDTLALREQEWYLRNSVKSETRVSNILIKSDGMDGQNILSKDALVSAMKLTKKIEDGELTYNGKNYSLIDICIPGASTCTNSTGGSDICNCQVLSILGLWNYNITTLENDSNYLGTLNMYGNSTGDLTSHLGLAQFDSNGNVVSAEAFSVSYFLQLGGQVNAWEEEVFLSTVRRNDKEKYFPFISLSYFTARSFDDEFGSAISGDLNLVIVSYIMAFAYLGASLGKICGYGSRWAVSLCALVLVAISTFATIGLSSYFGLVYGPVHSLLPFVLLGIGVDDVFIIVNAFNRERKTPREDEDNDQLIQRSAKACARSGASITVTSLTDIAAFAISSSSALPALSSFCAYAAIGIFLLWLFAATFFFAVTVQDEKRQRDNKWDIICCKKYDTNPPQGKVYEDNLLSSYFRNYHSPAILKTVWRKIVVLLVFSGLFAYSVYGAMNLPVEDPSRNFIPDESYINDFVAARDKYYASDSNVISVSGSTSINLVIIFENGQEIYDKRIDLAKFNERVSGMSDKPPYIAEPSDATYSNVISGLADYLTGNITDSIGITLGDDGWPTTYADFITVIRHFILPIPGNPGGRYINEVKFADESCTSDIAIHVSLQYAKLTKESRGKMIDDADKQIESMDATRNMIKDWEKEGDLPPAFIFCKKFIGIEVFKIIKMELIRNTSLAIIAVGIITFISLGNIVTAFLITISVAFCIVDILGLMYVFGLIIDSISVISIVLAVGLSVDYSAHVGHNFMVKSGNRNERVIQALADIGASVLNGALSTFLAVSILLTSTTYVFRTLSIQFALTVGLGVMHGLIFLPVLLSLVGPAPFSSAKRRSK